MRRLISYWVVSTIALLLAQAALPGINIKHWYHALWIALLLGLVNTVVGWIAGIISFVALPVNMLTLGCFGFIVSFILYTGAIYWLGGLLDEFTVRSFWWAVALAIVMALFSSLLNMVLPWKQKRQ